MANTTNLNLKKPGLDESALITDINNDMDLIDAAVNGTQSAIAIVSTGNTHAAIAAGAFVYIRRHSSLSEGLYTANSAISANTALTSSNVTAASGGALNTLNSKLGDFYTTRTSIDPNTTFELTLEDNATYIITHMTSSDTSQRIIMIMNRLGNHGLLELGKGTWQSYYTDSITNGKWTFVNGSYVSLINYIKF